MTLEIHLNTSEEYNRYSGVHLWQYGLWSFQAGGTKLERFLPKNQHTQKEIIEF